MGGATTSPTKRASHVERGGERERACVRMCVCVFSPVPQWLRTAKKLKNIPI